MHAPWDLMSSERKRLVISKTGALYFGQVERNFGNNVLDEHFFGIAVEKNVFTWKLTEQIGLMET